MPTIKWLHLSDFHVGLDKYGQTQLFKYILNHIKERKDKQGNIDFVFITGDIAQSGLKEEYDIFAEEFILPLEDIVGKECSLLTVAGNHDADREKQKFFSRDEILKTIEFFDPTKNGLENRQHILERFSAYSYLYQPCLNQNWLNSENGYFVYKINLKGINLGILGLNTAWLSKDEKDEGKLTAGKAIIEQGLEEIREDDVKLVLGHHPINWFYDKEPIRALFAKNHIVYLHGHLHKGGNRYEENAGHQFLALQSGAAFQGREEDKWINGLLWGQLDFQSGAVELEPYKWKREDQAWSLDSDAFPETFRDGGMWKFPLPQKIQSPSATSSKNHKKPPKPFSVPLGWEILDLGELNKRRNEPDTATILKYFDGRIPNWALALSVQIPRRRIVTELTQEINESALNKQSSITILLGAGGEGKSTAFLQTIASILETQNNWKVLYHKDENSKLSQGVISELSQEYQWLIASDDADLIAEDIYHAAQNQRDHIHFLLAARDTDWYDQKLEKLKWSTVFSKAYSEKKLNGLIEEDAKQVVQAWANYHDEGLGKLADLSIEEATQRLLTESISEAKQESAFFGALLRVRYGDDLKGHIKKLLDRLKERPIMEGNKYTLLDAFAYIAAMHTENQLFLSKLVLAQVLNLEVGKLRSKVLHPLGEEAAASMAGEYVFTRHRAIAETTMRLLEEELIYGIEPDEVYIELVTTAESLCQKGYFVPPNISKWRYLSDHFFDKNNYSLAIRLTQNLLKIDPTHSHMRVKLAQQFRKAGQPAIKVFREAPITDNDRIFFAEWGVSEGTEGNFALDFYLIGYALADETAKSPPDNETANICLSSLALASQELFKQYNKPIFIEACSAAVQLGLSVKYLNERSKSYFLKYESFLENEAVNVTPHAALSRIQEALITAYNQREADLPTWLLRPDDLHFESLKDLLNIR